MPTAVRLRTRQGAWLPLCSARWHDEATKVERRLLAAVAAPVLDVGCGPGRLVAALERLGRPALGVDPAPGAIALAQRRGATVLQRSVFDPLPGCGRWGTLLLLDGNIGIGGDPVRLLARCRDLAAPSGTVIVEVEPPGCGWRSHVVRLEDGTRQGPWFRWALVGVDGIEQVADAAGLEVRDMQEATGEGRWFAHLGRPERTIYAVA
jgi:SAM-dependent methyltransferase